ncbi:MAG TPA: hypothetical protein VFQ53_23240 [Kofleriaceae bacterium]|nr:hypothetical protein [Kofleriaceae bacterium]
MVAPRAPGHRLLQLGCGLFVASLVLGLLVPVFPSPRRATSAHVLGIVQSLWLVATGLVWPRLALSRRQAAIAAGLVVYGCLAAWLANLLAAAWAAGGATLPLESHAGSAAQELVIAIGLRSSVPPLVGSALLILWGLSRRGRLDDCA